MDYAIGDRIRNVFTDETGIVTNVIRTDGGLWLDVQMDSGRSFGGAASAFARDETPTCKVCASPLAPEDTVTVVMTPMGVMNRETYCGGCYDRRFLPLLPRYSALGIPLTVRDGRPYSR